MIFSFEVYEKYQTEYSIKNKMKGSSSNLRKRVFVAYISSHNFYLNTKSKK